MATMEKVAKENGQILALLTDDLVLFDSGLDSLSLAVVVARLEDDLMVDPFTGSNAKDVPRTLGDFFAAYERAIKSATAEFAT